MDRCEDVSVSNTQSLDKDASGKKESHATDGVVFHMQTYLNWTGRHLRCNSQESAAWTVSIGRDEVKKLRAKVWLFNNTHTDIGDLAEWSVGLDLQRCGKTLKSSCNESDWERVASSGDDDTIHVTMDHGHYRLVPMPRGLNYNMYLLHGGNMLGDRLDVTRNVGLEYQWEGFGEGCVGQDNANDCYDMPGCTWSGTSDNNGTCSVQSNDTCESVGDNKNRCNDWATDGRRCYFSFESDQCTTLPDTPVATNDDNNDTTNTDPDATTPIYNRPCSPSETGACDDPRYYCKNVNGDYKCRRCGSDELNCNLHHGCEAKKTDEKDGVNFNEFKAGPGNDFEPTATIDFTDPDVANEFCNRLD